MNVQDKLKHASDKLNQLRDRIYEVEDRNNIRAALQSMLENKEKQHYEVEILNVDFAFDNKMLLDTVNQTKDIDDCILAEINTKLDYILETLS
jgi:hypothetical protein